MAKSRMLNQMSEQMDVSKKEAGGEMRMEVGGLSEGQKALRNKNPEVVARMEGVSVDKVMDMADGGMARIKGAPPAQVKGLTYNDNGGKGTF